VPLNSYLLLDFPWQQHTRGVLLKLVTNGTVMTMKENNPMNEETNAIPTADIKNMKLIGPVGPLFEAIAKAQGQMGGAVKESQNPFFKSRYASLTSVLQAIRPSMEANGLALVQLPGWDHDNDMPTLTTIITHKDGGCIMSRASAPFAKGKTGPQEYGSVISYLRRYSAQAAMAVPSVDDDAEAAQMVVRQEPARKNRPPVKRKATATDTTSSVEIEVVPDQKEKNSAFAGYWTKLEECAKEQNPHVASKSLQVVAGEVRKHHVAGKITDAQRNQLSDVYRDTKKTIASRLKEEIVI